LAALALPPFNPPSLPSATAAGFFAGFGGGAIWPVAVGMTVKAASLISLLECLGMAQQCADSGRMQGIILPPVRIESKMFLPMVLCFVRLHINFECATC
jgi:hypothetical protein